MVTQITSNFYFKYISFYIFFAKTKENVFLVKTNEKAKKIDV